MNRSKFNLLLAAGLLASLMAGCTEPAPNPIVPDPQPTTGTISGTISLFPGEPGDLSNTRVAVDASLDDLLSGPQKAVRFTTLESGRSSGFVLDGLNPSNYFVEVWLDVDSDGFRDKFFPDIYALCDAFQDPVKFFFQAAPFQVRAGETVNINMRVSIP